MKKILILSALAFFLGIVGATASPGDPSVVTTCLIYNCPVNGG
jgi:hypothetical protein